MAGSPGLVWSARCVEFRWSPIPIRITPSTKRTAKTEKGVAAGVNRGQSKRIARESKNGRRMQTELITRFAVTGFPVTTLPARSSSERAVTRSTALSDFSP